MSLTRTIAALAFGFLSIGINSLSGTAQVAGESAVNSGKQRNVQGLIARPIDSPSTPTPFPLDLPIKPTPTLEFRAAEAMSASDRDLLAANEVEIARRAALAGYRIDAPTKDHDGDGGWGYEQAVCPVFPEHLIVEYSRINGRGDVSLFSAVIPRGTGHVRVIPAQRRSFTLYTPVSKNELTINDFNHIVKEEGTGLNPDWLTTGLCYAALASGHVRAALVESKPVDEHYPMYVPAKITVSRKGGAEILFADTSASPPSGKPMRWTMTFRQNGELAKVKHEGAEPLVARPVEPVLTDVPVSR